MLVKFRSLPNPRRKCHMTLRGEIDQQSVLQYLGQISGRKAGLVTWWLKEFRSNSILSWKITIQRGNREPITTILSRCWRVARTEGSRSWYFRKKLWNLQEIQGSCYTSEIRAVTEVKVRLSLKNEPMPLLWMIKAGWESREPCLFCTKRYISFSSWVCSLIENLAKVDLL